MANDFFNISASSAFASASAIGKPNPSTVPSVFASAPEGGNTKAPLNLEDLLNKLEVPPMTEEEKGFLDQWKEEAPPEQPNTQATTTELPEKGTINVDVASVVKDNPYINNKVDLKAVINKAVPADDPSPAVSTDKNKTEEKKSESKFTYEEKAEIAAELMKVHSSFVKSYPLTKSGSFSVELKLLSSKEEDLLQKAYQRARNGSEKRLAKRAFDGFDLNGKPFKSDIEELIYDNYMEIANLDRFNSILFLVHSIGGELLPKSLTDKTAVLESYPSITLGLIWEKAIVPFVELCNEVKRDFENF